MDDMVFGVVLRLLHIIASTVAPGHAVKDVSQAFICYV